MSIQRPAQRERVDFGGVSVYLGAQNGKYPDCNQLVLSGRDRRIAVDASRSSGLIGAAFDRADQVVLSHVHEDHIAGLERLPAVPVMAPEADLPALQSWQGLCDAAGYPPEIRAALRQSLEADFAYAPRPEATGYRDGQSWDLGGLTLRAFATPGHTPGHSALLAEEAGVLFVGDIDLSGFGPYYGDANSDLAAFRASIARLPEIPARVWVTGHHKGIYTDRAAFLADLAAYDRRIAARSEKLLHHLGGAALSLEALVARGLLYPAGFPLLWAPSVERRVIGRHLELLLSEGRVVAEGANLYRAV